MAHQKVCKQEREDIKGGGGSLITGLEYGMEWWNGK